LQQFHVRIKHTKANDLAEHDNGPFEITHILPTYRPTPSGSWHLVELNEPFIWNGTDNILFDTAFTAPIIGNQSGQVRIISSPNGYRFVRSTTNQIDEETISFANYRPQIRFVYKELETSVTDIIEKPIISHLSSNFPNPFNPFTSIRYQVSGVTHVEINVYNVRGQRVRSLLNEQREPGHHTVDWDGTDTNGHPVSSGVYLYRMTVGEFNVTRRMLLIK